MHYIHLKGHLRHSHNSRKERQLDSDEVIPETIEIPGFGRIQLPQEADVEEDIGFRSDEPIISGLN